MFRVGPANRDIFIVVLFHTLWKIVRDQPGLEKFFICWAKAVRYVTFSLFKDLTLHWWWTK
jgi:hypothetical protein